MAPPLPPASTAALGGPGQGEPRRLRSPGACPHPGWARAASAGGWLCTSAGGFAVQSPLKGTAWWRVRGCSSCLSHMSLPWGRWQWWQGTSILPQSILTWPPGKSLPGSGESCLGIIGAQNKGCMQMRGHGSGGGSAGQGLYEWRTPRSTRKIRRKKNKTKQH